MKYNKKVYISRLGEILVSLELIKKGIFTNQTNQYFGYDLITSNNYMIEVKTSSYNKYKVKKKTIKGFNEHFYRGWQFIPDTSKYSPNKNPCSQNYTHLILVCLDENENPRRFYIIPKKEIPNNKPIRIWESNKYKLGSKFERFLNNWNCLNIK